MAYRGDYPRGDASIDDVEQRGNRWYNDFNPVLRGGVGSPAGTPAGPNGGRKGMQSLRYNPMWQTPGDESMYQQQGAPGGRFSRLGQPQGGGGMQGPSGYGGGGGPGAARHGGYPDPVGPGTVRSKFKPGDSMARHYDDSYGQLLGSLAQGDQSGDIFGNVLRNFRGGIGDLKDFLESPAARMSLVYGIQNSPEFQESRDFSGFDTMFQAGAGDIANQAAQATSQGARLAGRTGQGRNAALRTALASQASQGAAQQTASLRGQVQMQRLQQAQRAFEQQRQLAALATGQITPRVEKEGGDETRDWINTAANVADIFI